jgi:drug/metabolite transporter superfamily protein YnfA
MRPVLNQIIANRAGVLILLFLAAFMEAWGDSYFQSALHWSSGMRRVLFLAAGVVVLSFYGLLVNTARWDFGKLLGVYVVLFFLVAQIVARIRFHQSTTPQIVVGGLLIVAGGIIISFSKP